MSDSVEPEGRPVVLVADGYLRSVAEFEFLEHFLGHLVGAGAFREDSQENFVDFRGGGHHPGVEGVGHGDHQPL